MICVSVDGEVERRLVSAGLTIFTVTTWRRRLIALKQIPAIRCGLERVGARAQAVRGDAITLAATEFDHGVGGTL